MKFKDKAKYVVIAFVSITMTAGAVYYHYGDDFDLKPKFLADSKGDYLPPKIEAVTANNLTPVRAELGKSLFFDPRLSGSNWISCGTCHNPGMGWSDGLQTAVGEGQNTLQRATPTILNTAYSHLLMWDGRFRSLEAQALAPIESESEMNQNLDELVSELKAVPGYVKMFDTAFPGKGISQETIGVALASFERTIVSTEAPFDRWIKGDETAISTAAKRGFELFEGKGHCSTCHSGFNFTDDGFHNIGLKSNDPGRHKIVPIDVTKGAFKTPTLRDITKTAPYMHNGAYATLDKVIDHYIDGGVDKSHLSPNFKAAELNKAEKADLIEFLGTLTGSPRKVIIPQLPV